jgi:hypothetical protein
MILELLRSKIRTSRESRYQIAKDSGVDQAMLCRIMQGKSCRVETADKLFDYFGLKVVKRKR